MDFRKSPVEGLVKSWNGRSVFLTGHTGFKGAWLALWLHRAGALVHGYALEPPTSPNLFGIASVEGALASDTRADLSDLARLEEAMTLARPEVVLHLAAQPLVRESYRDPLRTLTSNILGTAHVCEAARSVPSIRAMVLVTTDKVYKNLEWSYPYREVDPLGGRDPYSASKAAAEIVAGSYRDSFFANSAVRIATARAGNVIGGGDWAADRLIPDCLRAFTNGVPVDLRYPGAVRPWQHVLESLSGYVLLAERLLGDDGSKFTTGWNFGPGPSGDATVGEVATLAAHLWGGGARVELDPVGDHPPEAGLLRLDVTSARVQLGWSPKWSLERAIRETVAWHRAWTDGADMKARCLQQIDDYQASVVA